METKSNVTGGSTSSLFSTDIFDGAQIQEAPAQAPAKPAVLTKTEQAIYDSLDAKTKAEMATIVRELDLSDPNLTLEYGKEARTGIAKINSKALAVTRTKDLGKVGTSMSNLLVQLKGLDLPNQSRGIFGRARSYIEQLNARLSTVEKNVEKAVAIMQGHQAQLSKDNGDFEQLYAQNLAHFRALSLYVIAGKLKLDEERRTTLADLRQKAITSGDMADVEALNSYEAKLSRFDQLLSEFESSKLLCQQTAPAIRMAQENNTLLIQKFDFIFVTAIPAWQTQIQMAINLENSNQAAKAVNMATDFTNDIIRKNAEMLRQTTVDVARLSEREIIETDTLEYANQQLIDGLEEVFKIHEEGAAQRAANRDRKAMLEEDLKDELLRLTAGVKR